MVTYAMVLSYEHYTNVEYLFWTSSLPESAPLNRRMGTAFGHALGKNAEKRTMSLARGGRLFPVPNRLDCPWEESERPESHAHLPLFGSHLGTNP